MKKRIHQPEQFYKVIPSDDSDEATIMLYGYIGESYSYDSEKGWVMDGVTDIEFVREFNRLSAAHARIHLRINSYGGDFFHGNAILTAIQNSTAEVHTWNDGIAASMAADIFLCGHKRHMARNALLMIHPTWGICVGNAKEMRDTADIFDKMSEAALIATAAATGIEEEEMRRRYYADYADHWITYNDAVADGLLNTTEQYDAAGIEKSIETMTYKQIVEHFEKSLPSDTEAPGLLARVRSAFEKHIRKIAGRAPAQPSPQHTQKDMNLEAFRTAIADGTLDLEAVKAHLAEIEPAAPPTPAAPPSEPDPLTEVQKEITALKAQLTAAHKRLDDFAAAPGAARSEPALPDTDTPVNDPAPDPLAEYNTAMKQAAETGALPFRPTAI
jgi:ATP-dependent Clp protease, protease subunit